MDDDHAAAAEAAIKTVQQLTPISVCDDCRTCLTSAYNLVLIVGGGSSTAHRLHSGILLHMPKGNQTTHVLVYCCACVLAGPTLFLSLCTASQHYSITSSGSVEQSGLSYTPPAYALKSEATCGGWTLGRTTVNVHANPTMHGRSVDRRVRVKGHTSNAPHNALTHASSPLHLHGTVDYSSARRRDPEEPRVRHDAYVTIPGPRKQPF